MHRPTFNEASFFAHLRVACSRIAGKSHGGNMQKKLPTRPNLKHLRGQAKALLTAFKAGDPQAVRDFTDHHLDHLTDAVGLASAQLVVARKSGFSSWPKLVHYVEQLRALEGMWLF